MLIIDVRSPTLSWSFMSTLAFWTLPGTPISFHHQLGFMGFLAAHRAYPACTPLDRASAEEVAAAHVHRRVAAMATTRSQCTAAAQTWRQKKGWRPGWGGVRVGRVGRQQKADCNDCTCALAPRSVRWLPAIDRGRLARVARGWCASAPQATEYTATDLVCVRTRPRFAVERTVREPLE